MKLGTLPISVLCAAIFGRTGAWRVSDDLPFGGYFIAVTTVTVVRNLRWAPFGRVTTRASAGRESTFQSNTAHANTGAMVKKKGKNKSMDTGDDGFTYGEFAEACGQGKNGPSQPKLVCAFYPLLISVPCAFYSQVNLSRADRRRSV